MPQLVESPVRVPVPGGKRIDEYVGRASTSTEQVSVAHMRSPAGWEEPAQTPEFDEVTLVLGGAVHVEHDGGTLVVVEGPRFSTRAESRWFSAQGWSLVGMTGHPEAVLARELALCYSAVALVTDLDAGVEQGEAVTHAEVLRVFADNTARLRALLLDIVAALPASQDGCPCAAALDGLSPDPALP